MPLDLHIQLWINIKAEEDYYNCTLGSVKRKAIADYFHSMCCNPVIIRG